ncbi:MAG: hypothetical protein MRZ27_07550 [Eubacteriaceae bacterium]|nr:hypothetical protein [Eubacteriaceae bacterium]
MKAAESSIFVINITGKGKGFNCENMYGIVKLPAASSGRELMRSNMGLLN